jgi:hypothetical protein
MIDSRRERRSRVKYAKKHQDTPAKPELDQEAAEQSLIAELSDEVLVTVKLINKLITIMVGLHQLRADWNFEVGRMTRFNTPTAKLREWKAFLEELSQKVRLLFSQSSNIPYFTTII